MWPPGSAAGASGCSADPHVRVKRGLNAAEIYRETSRLRATEGVAMQIQSGRLLKLGYGKYVRSDDVVAVEPVPEGRGPGRRSLIWVRGLEAPLIASRAEAAIVDDLVREGDTSQPIFELRATLERVVLTLDRVPSSLWRVFEEETGTDVKRLIMDGRRILD